MNTTPSPILDIENLGKNFGRIRALKGINLRLERPGVCGFLGPNGAGKTTTFKLAAGLLRPTTGRVSIGGVDVGENPRAALANLGILFDTPAFYPYLSGRDNLQVISRWIGRDYSRRIAELLALVGLDQAGKRPVSGYSWGMKQRLGLAAALLADPPLLLLDEPTNGLDPAGIADVRRLLPKLAYEQGRTVMLSSHRMDEVEQICDRVAIIHQGEIVASGTPAELASGESSIEIHCPDIDSARQALAEMNGVEKVEQTGAGRLEVVAPGISAGTLNRLLIERGLVVEQVLDRRESLEEIFFRLTRTKHHEP
jgi:ABC-type multidrug transport system ATPase subunit